MIDPNEIVTIDELHAAMRFTQAGLKARMPMTAQEGYEFEKLIVEFRMRRAIRDEILRIAEEMAEEEDAADAAWEARLQAAFYGLRYRP